MRLGVCTNFLSEDKYSLHMDKLERLKDIFDFVEFPAFPICALTVEAFDNFLVYLKENRICCDYITNLFPGDLKLMAPSLDEQEVERYLDQLLPRLRYMGVTGVVFGSGPARMVPPEMRPEQADARMMYILQKLLLPRTESLGIRVLLEPLAPFLCNYMNTLDHAAFLCEACEGRVGIVADSMNLMGNSETPEHICRFGHHIWHVHLTEDKRVCPAEPLSAPMEAFVLALKENGYGGTASLECRMSGIEQYAQTKELVHRLLTTM